MAKDFGEEKKNDFIVVIIILNTCFNLHWLLIQEVDE